MKKTIMPTEPQECVTLRVEDCATILRISLSTAYSLVERAFNEQSMFKVLRLGKTYRIIKQSFFDFVYGEQKGA